MNVSTVLRYTFALALSENDFEMVCLGHDYSVRVNGQLVTTWTDLAQRSLAGHIGLQNYNDGKTVRFRMLRVKELP